MRPLSNVRSKNSETLYVLPKEMRAPHLDRSSNVQCTTLPRSFKMIAAFLKMRVRVAALRSSMAGIKAFKAFSRKSKGPPTRPIAARRFGSANVTTPRKLISKNHQVILTNRSGFARHEAGLGPVADRPTFESRPAPEPARAPRQE